MVGTKTYTNIFRRSLLFIMLTKNTIQAVRDAPLSTVISKYVTLKKKGVNYQGCCPFHTESTPSFTVNDAKGIYKCFGCGASGGVINFVMQHDKQPFLDAVKTIAELTGIELEYDKAYDAEKHAQQIKQKQTLSQVLANTVEIYKQNLLNIINANGNMEPQVYNYITSRGISKDVAIEWQLGWATTNWRNLTPELIADNNFEAAKQLGIIKTGKADGSHYDGYRSRLIFPIQNQYGQYIGMGGRYLQINEADAGKDYPKYINSTDSELYNKSKTLYGLHAASKSIKQTGYVNLVEGYMDVIAMHKVEACNTIGKCGTALTTQQAQIIKNYTNNVVIIGDADNAGKAANIKDIITLTQAGLKVEIGEVPNQFKDVDELIQKEYKPVYLEAV